MIGVLQVGHQAMADRYTYLPVIGLSIMLAWGLPEALRRVPYKEWVLGAAAAIALLVLAVCTLFQVPRWRDTETLFYSTLASTRDNATIHYYLANSFMRVNRLEEAIAHYEEALRIKPDRPDINDRMGIAMWRAGRRDEAVAHFEHALRENPAYSNAHVNLGTALFELRRYDEARRHFEAILEHIPNHGPSRAFLERIDAKTRLPR